MNQEIGKQKINAANSVEICDARIRCQQLNCLLGVSECVEFNITHNRNKSF